MARRSTPGGPGALRVPHRPARVRQARQRATEFPGASPHVVGQELGRRTGAVRRPWRRGQRGCPSSGVEQRAEGRYPAAPSAMAWCIRRKTPTCPPARPGRNHTCQRGREDPGGVGAAVRTPRGAAPGLPRRPAGRHARDRRCQTTPHPPTAASPGPAAAGTAAAGNAAPGAAGLDDPADSLNPEPAAIHQAGPAQDADRADIPWPAAIVSRHRGQILHAQAFHDLTAPLYPGYRDGDRGTRATSPQAGPLPPRRGHAHPEPSRRGCQRSPGTPAGRQMISLAGSRQRPGQSPVHSAASWPQDTQIRSICLPSLVWPVHLPAVQSCPSGAAPHRSGLSPASGSVPGPVHDRPQ